MPSLKGEFSSPTDDTASLAPSYYSSVAPSINSVNTLTDTDANTPLPSTTRTDNSSHSPALPTYKDDEVITVRIPASDLADSDDDDTPPAAAPGSQPRRSSWLSKLKSKSKPADQLLMMTRGDYLRYWARDSQGRYIGSEPEGTGRRIRRERKRQGERRGINVSGAKSVGVEDQFGKVEGTVRLAQSYQTSAIPPTAGFHGAAGGSVF